MNRYNFNESGHVHTLDEKPLCGTSKVAKVIGKGDALTWWASGMCAGEFGWLNPKKFSGEEVADALRRGHDQVTKLSLEDYGKFLTKAYRAFFDNRSKKATEGTDRHAILEIYVKHCIKEHQGKPYKHIDEAIQKFIDWSLENVEEFYFSEMNCYSEILWLGGIVDCGARLKTGKNVIIDFKSSKDAYADQFIQCALYDVQIGENGGFDSQGNAIFHAMSFDGYLIVPFGAEDITPRPFWDVKSARESAVACVSLYKFTQLFEV